MTATRKQGLMCQLEQVLKDAKIETGNHQYRADSVAGGLPEERMTHNAHAARAAGIANAIRERPEYQDVNDSG
jgi:hypothetical protein